MTKDDIVNMRYLMIFALAVMIAGMAMIPAEVSDADTPARLYFFDADNVCIMEVVLLPGEPLNNDDIPWHGSYKEWYDDDALRVYGGRTFDAGDHIIRAYDINNPPKPPKTEGGGLSADNIALIISGAVALIAFTALVLAIKRK